MGKRTQRSRETYNAMAAAYDTSPEGIYTRPHRAELLKRVALQDGDRILDVACGDGALLGQLSRQARVAAFGLDLSENMVAAARARHPGCTFVTGACVPLPFDDGSMDVITVSCAFHHFEEPRAFAAECIRVLKPGGRLYLAEPFFSPVVRWLANTVVFPFSKSGDVRVYSQKELEALLNGARFRDVEAYRKGTVLFCSARK